MITIGLVNNMSPAAMPSTERQFSDILREAAADVGPISLRLYRLAGAKPTDYGRLSDLQRSHLDGLIVTGAEPRVARLSEEPLWESLTKVIDWASENTASTIWSCLSAHAAAFYLDGIERHGRPEKIFGVFPSVRVNDHFFTHRLQLSNARPVWMVPHSRWNDLTEHDLTAHGYTVLAKSADAGVDLFVKEVRRSLFFFIQAHPEYSGNTLLREYLRDVYRFQSGQQPTPPCIPRNCLDPRLEAAVSASADGGAELLREHSGLNQWRPQAVQLYRNWLQFIAARQRALV